MRKDHALLSLDDTKKLAENIALSLRSGDVVTLAGDLGAGKTTFAQFLIQALSVQPVEVTSPTFTLVHSYPVVLGKSVVCELHHYDLYRIDHESALVELGLEDALAGVTLIEWPERLGSYQLPVSLALSFVYEKDARRRVICHAAAPHLKESLQ